MSTEPVGAGFNMVKELLVVVGKIINRLPNYNQKKREQYYDLVKKYDLEMSRNYDNRDDNQVGLAKKNLERFLTVFSTEIETKLKAEWQEEKEE